MKQVMKLLTFLLLGALFGGSCVSTPPRNLPATLTRETDPLKSVVKVNVTTQPFNFFMPWNKKPHSFRFGLATLISGNRLLLTADLVCNATFIELEKIKSGDKMPATVECVDYDANLAVLRPQDPAFLKEMRPLEIIDKLTAGGKASAWQFEKNGTPLITEGEMRRAEMGYHPNRSLLVYELNISLPSYASPTAMPVLSNAKLVGLKLSYSASTRSMVLLPAPVINHFLHDLNNGKYNGFPRGGFSYTKLDDPQLRNYVALPKDAQGVYVTYVRPGGSASHAGLKRGDVLLAIDEFDVDRHGQYEDPDYGKLNIAHLSSTRSFAGDLRTYHVWRQKQTLALKLKLQPIHFEDYPIAPYVYDRGPDYIIVGGLVFQELSREYLKSWGGSWTSRAPRRLVYYERNQWELFKPGQKTIILSLKLDTFGNIGYKQFSAKVLKRLNGKPIKRLADIHLALKTPLKGRFHRFEFNHPPRELILDAKTLDRDNRQIRLRYRVPRLRRFTGENRKIIAASKP